MIATPSSARGGHDAVAAAFLPLHKLAFGVAIGLAAAVIVFGLTAMSIWRHPGTQYDIDIDLLSQYFSGYTVTWSGAFIGAAWAGFVGFVAGWFFAFCRNFMVAVQLVVVRTRANFRQTRDFLDHI